MQKYLSLLALHLVAVASGCIGSSPAYLASTGNHGHGGYPSTGARTQGAHSLNAAAPRHFMEQEMRAMKCQRSDFGVYRASELRKLATLYEFHQNHPLRSSSSALQKGEQRRLSCGFDSDAEPCAWYAVALTPGLAREGSTFQRARFESFFDLEKFDCTSDRSFPFDEFFLIFGPNLAKAESAKVPMESVPEEMAAALEVRVHCQMDRAVLKFDYWTNNETPIMKICVIPDHFPRPQCEESKMDSNPLTFEIPPSAKPFRLRIQVENVGAEDMVFIDNVVYEGNICREREDPRLEKSHDDPPSRAVPRGRAQGDEHRSSTSPGQSRDASSEDSRVIGSEEKNFPHYHDSKGQPKKGTKIALCEALICDFNYGDFCYYLPMGIGATAEWRLGETTMGNPHTGIHKPNPMENKMSGFAYVGLDGSDLSGDIFVLESPKFALNRTAYLVFDLFQRSVGPQLRVCINNYKNCPYANPPIDTNEHWVLNQRVLLKKGIAEKVFFVAGRLKQNLFLAIDNVRLESLDFEEYCV